MKNEDRFSAIEAFLETAKRGSFVQAAQALEVNVSSVSRRVSALERRLGVRLVQRSTRRVSLTQAGQAYFEQGSRLLAQWAQLDEAIGEHEGAPRGLLRVALPNAFGRMVVLPTLPTFLNRYPEIDLDLHFSDAYADLVGQGFDVAVRIGELKDSGLVARKLGVYRRFLCASPAYLERAGTPSRPRDLASHRCLNFSPITTGPTWQLSGPGGPVMIDLNCRVRANDVEATYVSALHGFGIAVLAGFVAQRAIEEGLLVPVLARWKFSQASIYAVHASAKYLPARVRAFSDHLTEIMKGFQ